MFCYIENQANLIGKDVIFVKHMCVKSWIIIFMRENNNKYEKIRTFAIECISYNIRYAEFKEDTKPQSGKNVKPSYLFDVLNI